MSEIRRFFEDYKKLEKKMVVVEDFLGQKYAFESIARATRLYRQNRAKLRAA